MIACCDHTMAPGVELTTSILEDVVFACNELIEALLVEAFLKTSPQGYEGYVQSALPALPWLVSHRRWSERPDTLGVPTCVEHLNSK